LFSNTSLIFNVLIFTKGHPHGYQTRELTR